MARSLARVLIVALAGIGIGVPFPAEEARAQQFPASAVIRGENIRLRTDPAEVTEDLAILQRGDAVTITGDVTAADGLEFYPIKVVATGDAGWVRALFINPGSIVPLEAPALEPVPASEPEPAADAGADNGNNERRERPARRDRPNRDAAAEEDVAAADAAAAEEDAAAAEEAADQAAADAAAAEAPAEDAAAAPLATASGSGTARSERFALEPGRYRLTASMEASEAGNFVCDIFGPADFTESLFDETIDTPGPWTAETNLRIRGDAGDFYVECSEASGPWTISFATA